MNNSIILIAHNIRSLHNVGSIFRSADAFGVSKVFLTGYTGAPPDSKISKVALGAEHFVPWEKRKSLAVVIKKLKLTQPNIKIVALENNVKFPTTSLQNYKPKFPIVIILGEETKGHTKKNLEMVDDIIEIPMQGKKESLNVSVACAVILYELSKNFSK